jgi:nonribosomal peptide synthetase DhbF
VRQCAVVVREDRPGDQRLVAYVVADPAFDADAARATLRAALPEYMVPNAFMRLAALPLTPNGKIDRKALPRPEAPAVVRGPDPGESLMTPAQRRVAAIWRDTLHVERVGLHQNFFDLGGHSLLLVKLHAALKREFATDMALVELFQRTTVAGQADRLVRANSANDALQRAQERARRQALE